ncbi:ATP-binding protein [Streptomyces sp. NPDC049881]|uniref:ATP-binding protein n=1 Tax=Streptomyces sp. NPDC049881 TaxID=3155778 RepID=UPI003414506C
MTPPPTYQHSARLREFGQRFTSSPLGARLARQFTVHRLSEWDIPYGSAVSDNAALIVAELASNAVTHGLVPGREFELRLMLLGRTLRIDVSDAKGERRPPEAGEACAPPFLSDNGRGLLLVDALSDRWVVLDRLPIGKTVRAELDLPR